MTPSPSRIWLRPGIVRPWRCDTAALDVDGVLVDVESSFREAVRITVSRVQRELGRSTPWSPSREAVRRLKRAGGFNDDVDTAIALAAVAMGGRSADLETVATSVEAAGGGLGGLRAAAPDLPHIPGRLVLRIFDEHYWGADAFREHFGAEPEHGPTAAGLRALERPLVPPDFVATLRAAGVAHVALISGRTPLELDAALDLLRWDDADLDAVVTGDMARKPDPEALDPVVAATGAERLIYAGDVRDDWELVVRWRAERGDATVALGIAVGAEGAALRALGCDATVDSAIALPALLSHLAGAG